MPGPPFLSSQCIDPGCDATKPTLSMLARLSAFAGLVCLLACRSLQVPAQPAIEFTTLPAAAEGDGNVFVNIAGRVTGARAGQQIVVFSRAGMWWVQPLADKPFTKVQPDFSWKNTIHPGSAYAALLVDPGYIPPSTARLLPQTGGAVRAVAVAEGPALPRAPAKKLRFGGYEWEVRKTPGIPAEARTVYDPANAWVDENGFLHLRIAGSPGGWTSADLSLARSLGYGSYRFVVRDVADLEPSAALSISIRDDAGIYREMNTQISRWGQTGGKNAQYIVQPYFVPANMVRFLTPAGTLTWSLSWQPGRASFRTVRGSSNDGKGETADGKGETIAAHTLTSGVPAPQTEAVRLTFSVFYGQHNPLRHGAEVIFEKFEYLP
jgi:hypothetical protein